MVDGKGVGINLDIITRDAARSLFARFLAAFVPLTLPWHSGGVHKLGKAEPPLSDLWESSFVFICVFD